MTDTPLLEVRNLVTRYHTDAGPLTAVDGVDLTIGVGERFAVVGESGSGKSAMAMSILGLIDPPGTVDADQVTLGGRDLRRLSRSDWRAVRGNDVALVMQDPLGSLSPTYSVGEQIAETVRRHHDAGAKEARDRAVDLLTRVGIPNAAKRAREYPHQFSGGMRQRVAIAIALSCSPTLLIADEPTTALDVTVQAQVIELLRSLSEERDMAVLLITHNLGVVAGFADEVAVMYSGRIVEQGDVDAIFASARHPYTRALLGAQTRLDRPRVGGTKVVPGAPPDPLRRPSGCAFHPRCELRDGRERCVAEEPALRPVAGTGASRCHFAEELIGEPIANGSGV